MAYCCALANFDPVEFRKANTILEAEEIQQDVKRLKFNEKAATDRLAALRDELKERRETRHKYNQGDMMKKKAMIKRIGSTIEMLDTITSSCWKEKYPLGGRSYLCVFCGEDERDGHNESCHLRYLEDEIKALEEMI